MAKFGADTPISLQSTARQASFREIKDQCLKHVLMNGDPLVLVVKKMILGAIHLAEKEYGRDNLHISSWFLASLLDSGMSKAKAKMLLVKMFRKDLLALMMYWALLLRAEVFRDHVTLKISGLRRGCEAISVPP